MADLIKELIDTSKNTHREQPLQDKNGNYYYDQLPEGTRLATPEDISIGTFAEKTPFLVHGYHSDHFECYRIKDTFPICFYDHLDEERVFVWND